MSNSSENNELFKMPSCGCASCASDAQQNLNKVSQEESIANSGHHRESALSMKLYLFRLFIALTTIILLGLTDIFAGFEFTLFLFAYVLAGYEVLTTAIKNICKGKIFDENFLMAIASLGAFILGEYAEGVGVMIFYGLGELMQDAAVAKSKRNISKLMDIRPDVANLKVENGFKSLSPEQIKINDIIVVRPGEKVPLDGEVTHGHSYVDTMALTGESVPRYVAVGDKVLSGSVNKDGLLEIIVTNSFNNSTVAKILKLVQYAGERKAKSEKFITKFARYYTPAVVGVAVFLAIFPPLFGFGTYGEWIYKSLSFLIISCPCALVLSIPISFFGGIGGAARNGILVKGGNYLETLYSVKTIVFDKTGTITKGEFKVEEVHANGTVSREELLEIAAIAEANSTHPIAKSILSEYAKEVQPANSIQEIAGQGIIAQIGHDQVHVGNRILMEQINIKNLPVFDKSCVYVAKNKEYLGYILIADQLKESSVQGIKKLKEVGIQNLVMLTGDTKIIAQEIATKVGIDDVRSQLLPHEKVYELEKIMDKSVVKTAFVGDGINDAPVLSRADIGFAMGGLGSDAAIEAADVVIMNDDITKIGTAIKIAKKTRQIVVQNIIFALGVKGIIMVLAFLGVTSIWFAIFADVGVAILAILNAMRAMLVK